MGCCLKLEGEEFKQESKLRIPEKVELANRPAPGTWGVSISSDEDSSSEGTLANNSRRNKKLENTNNHQIQKSIHKSNKYTSSKTDKIKVIDKKDIDMQKIQKQEELELEKLRIIQEKERKKREEKEREEREKERKEREERERKERERKEKERREREEKERIERERKEKERREREAQEERERIKRLKRARQRKNAMKELLSTEQTYVSLLKKCIDVFVDPLLVRPELLDDKIPNGHRILFSDIKIIYGINEAFLDDLNAKYSKYDDKNGMDFMDMAIGDCLKRFTPYFRSYQSYLNNYEKASILLSKLTKIESNKFNDFNEWYNTEKLKHCNNNSLDFYLILPIQRLPRYKLCLNEIIKYTESDHKDLNDLNFALKLISETVSLCNDRMKDYESRSIVREIDVKLVTPSRRFIKQGMLSLITGKGDEHKLTFLLFSDLLCYATGNMDVNNSGFRLQMRLPIDDVFHVQDLNDSNSMEKYKGRAFEIHSSVKSILVYAENMKDKTEWLLALTDCFEKIQNGMKYKGKTRYELSAAVWIPDDWSDVCMVSDCRKKFNSITNRRHHCRWCGRLICGSCGKYKLAHKIHLEKMVKPVCKKCFNMHHQRFRANTGSSLYNENDDENDENDDENDESDIQKTKKFLDISV